MVKSTAAQELYRQGLSSDSGRARCSGESVGRAYYNVAIHDVTASTLMQVTAITNFLLGLDVSKVSYLIIPCYHDQESIVTAAARLGVLAAGQELVLHGFTHLGAQNNRFSPLRLLTDGEAECLACQDVQARVARGLRLLTDAGLAPSGFIPPAWLIDRQSVPALRACGLTFMCTRGHVYDLVNGRRYFAPVLTFSSRGWIEALSLYTFALLFRLLQPWGLIRIAIHPHDLAHPRKVRILQHAMRVLARKREAVSFGEFLQRRAFLEDL